jgi:hypothetical protein
MHKLAGMMSAFVLATDFAVKEPVSALTCNARYFDELGNVVDVGTLELADYVGAARRGGNYAPRPSPQAQYAQQQQMRGRMVPASMLIPQIPGVPAPGARLQPLGLGATAFTAASGTLLQLQASPQRPFKGQRLIIDLTRTGATSTGLVTVTRLDVGTSNQLVGSGGISASAFQPTSFDANVSLDPATPGVNITLQLSISAAPGGADRVDIGGTIIGTTVG